MITPTNYVIARAGSTLREPWQLGDFYDFFLPNIGKGQKNVLPSERGVPGTLLYDKYGHGFCNTFIKRLDEVLR